ncbi:MAG: hypothetical protein Q7J32_08345 [Sphingomonadaceae bacterium]|nr:hypothetical protein [Sphingomonadaceae bacterium]
MLKKLLIASTALLLAAPSGAQVPDRIDFTISPTQKTPGMVQLELSYRTPKSRSNNSNPVALAELQGLTAAQLASTSGGPARFRIVRDAGSLDCDGIFRGGRGTGDCRFAPNPGYAAALAKRGIGSPGADQQFQLALHGADLAVADELARQGYKTPSISQLVETGIFNVDVPFLKALDTAGYRVGTVSKLVEMKIHGVSPDYIRELGAVGANYRKLPVDALVEMRIHGVTPARIRDYAKVGYTDLSRRQIVNMAIHGVSPDYVRQMAEAGYRNLTPEQLVNMRIHGVNAEMARVAKGAVRTN